jgi:hypothetical protein
MRRSEEMPQIHGHLSQGIQYFYKQLSTFCLKLGEISDGEDNISPNASQHHR